MGDKLEIGSSLGHYRIVSKIGSGGMGEVYLAEDTRLRRKIALKVLPDGIAKDEDRLRRFEQEAFAASALNHPNILTIYEFGTTNETHFIAAEFVEGETLRERLAREAVDLIESLDIAVQIASALSAAHVGGIIHRDIKPENIMIRTDGIVKVLDFGLAKLTEKRAINTNGEAETQALVKTNPGVVMGTVSYMSPEQSRGKQTDERTDIWSLGVVLYEMLARKLPFSGETIADTIAAILTIEPPLLVYYFPDVPAELQRIVSKTLRKNCDERYQHSKDLQIDLKDIRQEAVFAAKLERSATPGSARILKIADSPTQIITPDKHTGQTIIDVSTKDALGVTASQSTSSSAEYIVNQIKRHKWKTALATLGICTVIAAVGWAGYQFLGSTGKKTAAMPFQNIRLSVVPDLNNGSDSALSPDAKYIAFTTNDGAGNNNLKLRQLVTGSTSDLLPAQPGTILFLAFSPDGNYIYYLFAAKDTTQRKLFRLPTLGGGSSSREIMNDVDGRISFAPDGRGFAFRRHNLKENYDAVIIADIDGVELQTLATTRGVGYNLFGELAWSPDGKKIMVLTSQQGQNNSDELLELSVSDGSGKLFEMKKFTGIGIVHWLKSGSGLVFTGWDEPSAPTQIWYAAYPGGETRQITNDANDYLSFSIAEDNSTLIASKADFRATLSAFDPLTKVSSQLTPEYRLLNPTASDLTLLSSGKIIFVKPREGDFDNLWMTDATGKNAQAISPDLLSIFYPVVTPDDRYIVFTSTQTGNPEIWRTDINGNNPVQLTNNENQSKSHPQITPDSKSIFFLSRNLADGKTSIMRMSLDGKDLAPIAVEESPLQNVLMEISPEGKRIALGAFDPNTRKSFLIIVSFDGTTIGRIDKQIEVESSGSWIHWPPDGKSVTYTNRKNADNLYEMPIDGARKPKQLTNFTAGTISDFVWSHDGRQLFIIHSMANSELILIKDSQTK